MKKSYERFIARQELLKKQYDDTYYQKQHQRGKLTARERILLLFDEDTFEETDAYAPPATSSFGKTVKAFGDGVITGFGKVNGRLVYVYSQDFNVLGGSLGATHAAKIAKIQDMALKTGSPMVGLIDSGGARIQEGISSLDGYASIFKRNVLSSGVIPQISVIMGPAAGGAVYSPALTDFIFMTADNSYMFVTGPNVVKEVLNETVSTEDLGGASVHASKSGVADFVYSDDENTILGVKKLLSYLPSNNMENPPLTEPAETATRDDEQLRNIVPEDPDKPYDVKEVVRLIVDNGDFLEISENHAANIFTAFARIDGRVVGIVANQPKVMAGTLDTHSSVKGARFINICDAFNIPIVTLVDVPGFLPGTDQEHEGIIRHGAKILYAYCEATVPKITMILRKAYGGAYIGMCNKELGADLVLAWPSAQIAVMGAEGAANIVFKNDIKEAADPVAKRQEKVAEYEEKFNNPYRAAEMGYVDDIIEPATARMRIISGFDMLASKRLSLPAKKHGNIPL